MYPKYDYIATSHSNYKMGKCEMDINLNDLELDELKALKNMVEKQIANYEERKRQEAITAAENLVREMGFKSLDDVLGGKTKSKKTAQPPKYQHPENPELTWTGKGRRPAWFVQHIDAGGKEEDLLIK